MRRFGQGFKLENEIKGKSNIYIYIYYFLSSLVALLALSLSLSLSLSLIWGLMIKYICFINFFNIDEVYFKLFQCVIILNRRCDVEYIVKLCVKIGKITF